jgi:hypothetical protein
LFAKIFNQIYDSSIVENPETRFTFMDLLILADKNGVVDVTHEAIARRTNRPIDVIRRTIAELEGPDPKSRTPDAGGARIFRLDDHRDWGWGIVNYDYFRNLAREEQRREKTRLRVAKHREKLRKSLAVTSSNAPVTLANDFPSASAYSSVLKEGVRGRFEEWMKFRRGLGKKIKDWDTLFTKQAKWLSQFGEPIQIEILEQSMRNGWQGLFEPQRDKQVVSLPLIPSWGDRKAQKQMIDELQEKKNELFKLRQRERRQFTPDEQRKYDALAKRLEQLNAV